MKPKQYNTLDEAEQALISTGNWYRDDNHCYSEGIYEENKHIINGRRFKPTKKSKYRSDIDIYLNIGYSKKVIFSGLISTNCVVGCCGENIGYSNFSLRKVKKLIETSIYKSTL